MKKGIQITEKTIREIYGGTKEQVYWGRWTNNGLYKLFQEPKINIGVQAQNNLSTSACEKILSKERIVKAEGKQNKKQLAAKTEADLMKIGITT